VLAAAGSTRSGGTASTVFVAPGLKNNPFSFNPLTLYN
jgi:hypothetical protein